MLEGSVAGDKEQEDKVVVDVREGELISFNEWFCEWEEETEGRRQKDGVSYAPQEQTWHVPTPT